MVRPAGKLSEIPLDVYHDTINVNQNGAWYTLKLVPPQSQNAILFSTVFLQLVYFIDMELLLWNHLAMEDVLLTCQVLVDLVVALQIIQVCLKTIEDCCY